MIMNKRTITIAITTFILLVNFIVFNAESVSSEPTLQPWPLQFHSRQIMNDSNGLIQLADLWYDWLDGRNFNIIQNQFGALTYDLEWDNGTSFFFYTFDSDKICRTHQFPVGILRPNWLEVAEYLGQKYVDGFLWNVWEKLDFNWYYEDVVTKKPLYWEFYKGQIVHEQWQAPVYCFKESVEEKGLAVESFVKSESIGRLMRH